MAADRLEAGRTSSRSHQLVQVTQVLSLIISLLNFSLVKVYRDISGMAGFMRTKSSLLLSKYSWDNVNFIVGFNRLNGSVAI